MKKFPVLVVVLVSSIAGESMASSCDDPRVEGNALVNLLEGNTVCAMFGGDRWQEQHRGGGQLWDYKLGPDHPVDPTTQVGEWAVVPSRQGDVVRYMYGSGGNYNYKVHGSGDVGQMHSFCGSDFGGVDIHNAVLLAGENSCP